MKKINYIKTPNQSITPSLGYYGTKTIARFNGSCLKQGKVTYNHGKIVNIYIVYELSMFYVGSFFTLGNCLFGAVSLTKNANIDKYKYSGYGIGFNRKGSYPIGNEVSRNVIIFGVDIGSFPHIPYNKGKDILILGKDSTQGFGEHSLTAKKNWIWLILQSTLKVFV